MSMECIGSLDQGTQSTRFLIYDREAKVIARHQVEFTQITPKPGCVLRPQQLICRFLILPATQHRP